MKLEIRIDAHLGDEEREQRCLDAMADAVKGVGHNYVTADPSGCYVEVSCTWPERKAEG